MQRKALNQPFEQPRMNLTIHVKKIVSPVLYYSGIIHLLKRLQGYPGIILGYHRVLPSDSKDISFIQPGMYVTTETFEKHMAFIAQNYKIMRLMDVVNAPSPKNACIVTFDDGWADNYIYALPIIKRYGIPATIFLTTNMVGKSEWPWPDRLSYYIQSVPESEFIRSWTTIIQETGLKYQHESYRYRDRIGFKENIIDFAKSLETHTLIALMENVDKIMTNQKRDLMKMRSWLTWDEVQEMKKSDITFGSHSHNHHILNRIPLNQAQEEVETSRRILSDKTGSVATMFCYPNGGFNDEIVRIVSNAGYRIAVTTKPGSINGSSSFLTLNRNMLHDDITSTIPMLMSVLANKIPFF